MRSTMSQDRLNSISIENKFLKNLYERIINDFAKKKC